jgi:ribose-phosphate pyrophosphokinase
VILLNGKVVEFGNYPNGETLMPEIDSSPPVGTLVHRVEFRYETDADLIHLFLLGSHLGSPKTLTITYMPYSRMDRAVGDHCFSLEYIAEFINAMEFNVVSVIEPHSDVTLFWLDNAEAVYVSEELVPGWVFPEVGFDRDLDYVVFPDEGARTRYADCLSEEVRTITAVKERDFDTGEITSIEVAKVDQYGLPVREGAKAVIWDDLCSRGGTFMGVGQQLKDMGFAEVHLYVTHIESAALDGPLLAEGSPIDSVFATDTMPWMNNLPKYSQVKPGWGNLHIRELTGVNRTGKVGA